MPNSVTPDIDALIKQLKDDVFIRWMRAAQKKALLEWRDKQTGPGLAARFTHAGNKFYKFTPRSGKYDSQKGYLPDFVRTGSLRDSMTNRKPVSVNGVGEAITRMKYGGGALSFLGDKKGITSVSKASVTTQASVAGYSRTIKGAVVSVRAYTAIRHGVKINVSRGGLSYADEFADFTQDAPWIKQRSNEIFGQIVKSATMKNGQLRSRYAETINA